MTAKTRRDRGGLMASAGSERQVGRWLDYPVRVFSGFWGMQDLECRLIDDLLLFLCDGGGG